MRLRIHIVETVILLLLGLVLALMIWDLHDAWEARACSDIPRNSNGCYCWGCEGPFADSPNYGSKEAYLRSGLINCLALAAAMTIPFLVTRVLHGLIGIALVFLIWWTMAP